MIHRATDPMPMITLVTSLAASVIGTVVMLLAVYSGLFASEFWQIALSLYFLAVLPVSGWMIRPKRRY